MRTVLYRIPEADGLLLIGQMHAAPIVVALKSSGGRAEEVLRAALWGQVGIVARILCHLIKHGTQC